MRASSVTGFKSEHFGGASVTTDTPACGLRDGAYVFTLDILPSFG